MIYPVFHFLFFQFIIQHVLGTHEMPETFILAILAFGISLVITAIIFQVVNDFPGFIIYFIPFFGVTSKFSVDFFYIEKRNTFRSPELSFGIVMFRMSFIGKRI